MSTEFRPIFSANVAQNGFGTDNSLDSGNPEPAGGISSALDRKIPQFFFCINTFESNIFSVIEGSW
jgi:hypothetical protein